MGLGLRASLFVCSAAVLAACASNPEHGAAPIDFRGSAPVARGPAPGSVMSSVVPPSAQQPRFSPAAPVAPPPAVASNEPAPLQLVADLGPGVGLSATDEARGMAPEAGGRPGGSRRLGPDDVSARMVTVMPGDTLYDISRQYNVNMRALIETNRLQPPYALSVGATIQLPPPNVHVVSRGETLYSVSRRYNVDTRSLALLNGLVRPWTVYPGDELLLPPLARDQARDPRAMGAEPVVVAAVAPPPVAPPAQKPIVGGDKPIQLAPPVAKPATPAAKPAPAPVTTKPAAPPVAVPKPPQAAVVPPPVAPKAAPQPAASGAHDFIWPVSGNVLKGFGPSADGVRNDGVNIAAPRGTEIKAAATGEVVYAGSELVGFGNLILIRHPGGWVTAYAHADTMVVKEGDLVKQGQRIGTVGTTGNASTPQLHFELRKGKEPVNPAGHLPGL